MINLKTNNLYKITTFVFVFINLFSINALSEENHIIKVIEKEWNRTQTLNGKFHQKIDGDKVISGNFFIEKPYRSNFTYHNQAQNIITSKYFINFVDKKGKLLDRYPIINQPIYKLFSKNINLNNIFHIKSVEQDQTEVKIKLAPKDKNEIQIDLTFHSKDYLLKKWEIVDALGQTTYLEFTNVKKNISIDQNLFIFEEKIEY
jgi:outer membrane lipoprotein-sorting protein|tara:strand:- start:230 stop:838 length:609 start_codon:yes stop_codon:yes gene_type:complete